MISRSIVILLACSGVLIIMQSLMPRTMAMKSTRNIHEFMIEDQRTRKKHNYMFQRDRNNDILRNKNNGLMYDMESLEIDSIPEDYSNLVMDYANMKKNDVFLLDNSIETRTRKRGNIKRQNIPDPPCSCEYTNETVDFGENAFPRHVESRNCSELRQSSCLFPYVCKETLYDISVLKRRQSTTQPSEKVPNELKFRWIAEKWQISVGCVCTRDYRDTINQD
uniref:Prothoracicotropic hormone preproprotein n=1 Tax=Antheraea yamamai TaxID=7121 RepID=Q6SA72_ANTYA|nr:prothoracicotropic hormone preproprotein [Antheraea yamamai]